MHNKWLLCLVSLVIFFSYESIASQKTPEPNPRDTCLVCGMFVAHYPNWISTVLYNDGKSHHFDGPRDLFTYLLDMKKWAQGHDMQSIQSIAVKDYYSLKQIDARSAYYVIGSDVFGPMGHELVPFISREHAETFMQDHQGKKIYRFNDINQKIITVTYVL